MREVDCPIGRGNFRMREMETTMRGVEGAIGRVRRGMSGERHPSLKLRMAKQGKERKRTF